MLERNSDRKARWYFGGLAGIMAVCVTHPLDVFKVQLQLNPTQNLKLHSLPYLIEKEQGVMGFYKGLSAAILRQVNYSTSRFALYDMFKTFLGSDMTFYERMGAAGLSGAMGAIPGVPPGKVNVRMQNDGRLPPTERKNYKHVFHGLLRVYKDEGPKYLFSGATMGSLRAGVMAIGQLFGYDQFKMQFRKHGYPDNIQTHFMSSLCAALLATTMTQPFDVLKTRIMNAPPGLTIKKAVVNLSKEGPLAFYSGYIPAFLRLGSHTILMFVFYEQLRLYLGELPNKEN